MRCTFFGAAPDTGNLGVSALCYATLHELAIHDPALDITVFDYTRGHRDHQIDFGDGTTVRFRSQGAIYSRRLYRPENLRLMQLAGIFGGLGNSGIKAIQQSDAVLDISGGDSFTDLYGQRCFKSITLPKLIAIQQKRPLILLPQTYGPFTDKPCENRASEIVKRCHSAWARDARSFEVLQHLLGSSFDSSRHRCGVDMAFGLPTIRPQYLSPDLADALCADNPKIGINISGLIYNNFPQAKQQFGFKADYQKAILDLSQRFLSETDCTIFLVPHVVTPSGNYESDTDACQAIASKVGTHGDKRRLFVCPAYDNPCLVKWIISQMNWFCGTRMHATIAALSSAVPVAAISYSPKTLGVFESCGQGNHVADPKVLDSHELVSSLWTSWKTRQQALSSYKSSLQSVRHQSTRQISSIFLSIAH